MSDSVNGPQHRRRRFRVGLNRSCDVIGSPPPSPSVLSAPLHSAIVLLNILYLAIPFNDDKMNDYYHWISNQWLFWYRSNIIRPLAFYPTEDCTASIHWESQLDYITSNLFTTHRSGFVFLRGGDVTVNTQSIINYICYDDLTATLLQPYCNLTGICDLHFSHDEIIWNRNWRFALISSL